MPFYIPPKQVLTLSKGGDLIIDFMQKIDDVYTNYAPGVTVTLEIDRINKPIFSGAAQQAPTTINTLADISTYHAVCKIESTVADGIPEQSLWRCVVSYPTTPTTQVVAMNGVIRRSDGN